MSAIRWGIASCGSISNDFATAMKLLGRENHVVTAVAARNLESAKTFAKKFGAKKFYDRYEALAEDPDVDIVYVGMIHPKHLAVSKVALEAKKPVLCEKPMCMNLAETKELIDCAKRNNTFLMEAMWARFFPVYKELQARLDKKEIGEVKHAYVTFGRPCRDDQRITKKEAGGGVMLDIGVYAVHWILLAMGMEKPQDMKIFSELNDEGVEMELNCIMRFSNNRFATFLMSTSEFLANNAYITGTKGTISVPLPFWCPTKLTGPSGTFEVPLEDKSGGFVYPNSEGLKYEIDAVGKYLKAGVKESPVVPHSYSLLMAEIMENIRKECGVKI